MTSINKQKNITFYGGTALPQCFSTVEKQVDIISSERVPESKEGGIVNSKTNDDKLLD